MSCHDEDEPSSSILWKKTASSDLLNGSFKWDTYNSCQSDLIVPCYRTQHERIKRIEIFTNGTELAVNYMNLKARKVR
ncbi:Uncharacterised protein [Yersinia kristensenii]|nr:Uncharacterised protein [Yersinia kristensenii]